MSVFSTRDCQLAQFNCARARFQLDDTRMRDFVAALDKINKLAEKSPGFIWRLQTGAGHSIDIRPSRTTS